MISASLVFAALSLVWILALVAGPEEGPVRVPLNGLVPVGILAVLAVNFSVAANEGLPDRLIYTHELRLVGGSATVAEALGESFEARREILYVVFLWAVSRGGTDTTWLYLCVAVACALGYISAMLRLIPAWQTPMVWLTTLSMGLLMGYSSLVVRQGLSMTCIFGAICLWLSGARVRWWALALLGASLLHWSAIALSVGVALVALGRMSLRAGLCVWLGAALAFLTGMQTRMLGPVVSYVPGLADYTDPSLSSVYTGGTNRLDFFLLSAAILCFGLWGARQPSAFPWYRDLLVVYCVLNSYFLAFGFILYSDRLAAYSWMLAPLIVGIPLTASRTASERLRCGAYMIVVTAYGLTLGPLREMFGLTA